jgi:hypothetical protein
VRPLRWCASVEIASVGDAIRLDTARLRRAQRQMDRQHRAGSPGCFNPDGTHTPGRCAWQRSNTAKQSALRVAELHRKAASAGGDRLYEFNPNTAALST